MEHKYTPANDEMFLTPVENIRQCYQVFEQRKSASKRETLETVLQKYHFFSS